MTSPAKYAARLRAQKNDHGGLSPKNSTAAVETKPLLKESVVSQLNSSKPDLVNPPAGFTRQSFAPEGSPDYERMAELSRDVHLYKGHTVERHGVLIEQVWEPETGIYYLINSTGSDALTRSQLSEIMGMVCGAFLWEEGDR
jgi:hypothetical protein